LASSVVKSPAFVSARERAHHTLRTRSLKFFLTRVFDTRAATANE
jgi:hypothetical protein